jgi:DNA-binding response OmpR family regulator
MKNHILVIDDEELNLKLMEKLLTKMGYSVSTAMNARSGLALALNETPGLIMIDYMMPGQDGLSLLKDIRSTPDLQYVPVIMVTSATQSNIVARAIKYGVNDYLVKPIDPTILADRTQKWLPLE